MAPSGTVQRLGVTLSDVDRGVYETLDLRMARHPSESARYFWQRALAYCLSYEDGIAFSKGGLSSNEEAPLAVRDGTGMLLHWIEIGAPSPERLHKASKSARVSIYTHELPQLLRQVEGKTIHKASSIEICAIDPKFIDALAEKIERRTKLEVTRTDGSLYVTVDGTPFETTLQTTTLA